MFYNVGIFMVYILGLFKSSYIYVGDVFDKFHKTIHVIILLNYYDNIIVQNNTYNILYYSDKFRSNQLII